MISGLKWEHEIYNKNFSSAEEFKVEIEKKIRELTERKNKLKKLANKDYDDWENTESKDQYDEILEKTIYLIEKAIDKLEDYHGSIK